MTTGKGLLLRVWEPVSRRGAMGVTVVTFAGSFAVAVMGGTPWSSAGLLAVMMAVTAAVVCVGARIVWVRVCPTAVVIPDYPPDYYEAQGYEFPSFQPPHSL